MTNFHSLTKIAFATMCLFVAGFMFQYSAIAADKMTARQIMEKVTEHRKLDGSEAVSKLVIHNKKGQKRVRSIAMVTKLYDGGKTEKKLMRFLAPADVKGTGMLTFDYEKKDDDIWMFMPSLRKTRRIVSSEKSKSFMGSEFSYNDMNIPDINDYNYKTLKEEKIDGADCWMIEVLPKSDDIADEDGYSKKLIWIGKADFAARKSQYFDLDGEFLKEMLAQKLKLIDKKKKRYRAMYMSMVNKQNGRKSEMIIDKIQLSLDAKDDYFTTRYLERQ